MNGSPEGSDVKKLVSRGQNYGVSMKFIKDGASTADC